MIRRSGLSRLFPLFRFSGLLGLFSVLCGSACGQKGPPLAPLVFLPRPVAEVIAKRTENDVVLQFTVPSVNTDGSGPADLRKVEVYAHTGPLPAPTDFLKYGTLVASIDIRQPPEPPTPEEQKAESKEQGPVAPKPEEGAASTNTPAVATTTAPAAITAPLSADLEVGLVEQGQKTTVRETLTPKHREIGPMPPARPIVPPEGPVVVVERIETPGTVNFDLAPQRYYILVGVSESRNRRGPFAGPFQVALLEPLSPPETVDVAYTADAISLNWPAQPEDMAVGATVGGPGVTGAQALVNQETEGTFELYADLETDGTEDVLVAAIAEKAATGIAPKPRAPVAPPPPPTPRFGYNVYEAGATGAGSAPSAPNAPVASNAPVAPVAPLNTALLTAPGFVDSRVEFGVERCYVVRRVEMAGTVAIESAASIPTCVTPADFFPPAPPKSLAHIAAGNGVSLIWEANTEPDLGGYLVLRGEAPGDTLSPLTPAPITDTSFLDTTVLRGRTYFYRVVAVDRSTPPNPSAPSDPVEETIR